MASCRCVRPILTMSAKASAFAWSASRRRAHVGITSLAQRLDRGDAHGGREDVVAGLALVDVVVGMDEALLPALAAQDLAGAVGEHLVHVHVGLGAAAGLPDHERELRRRASRPAPRRPRPRWPGPSSRPGPSGPCSRGRRPSSPGPGRGSAPRGMRSPEILKLVSERWVWAPQRLVGGDLDRSEGVLLGAGPGRAHGCLPNDFPEGRFSHGGKAALAVSGEAGQAVGLQGLDHYTVEDLGGGVLAHERRQG